MKIAVITGGETGERDVSIRSAKNVVSEIDFAEIETFIFPEDTEKFIGLHENFNLVIPLIHGRGGEDGELQTFLKSLNIPFIFSSAETHEICIDKKRTKEKVDEINIISPKDASGQFPLFAKPRFGGSSIASKLCKTKEEFEKLQKENPEIEFITEEPISGREFTVGVIEYRKETLTLPVIEIIPKSGFFDFESKYDPEKLAQEVCPAQIPISLSSELQKQALDVHKYLNVKHISRSDFIVTPENKIYFLEINTIPGMTNTSLIPKMLKEVKIELKDLLKEWCT